MTRRYAVTLTLDDNETWLVTVPDIPEAVTFGFDRKDALLRARDAIETVLMALIEEGEPLPEPQHEGQDYVLVHLPERSP